MKRPALSVQKPAIFSKWCSTGKRTSRYFRYNARHENAKEDKEDDANSKERRIDRQLCDETSGPTERMPANVRIAAMNE